MAQKKLATFGQELYFDETAQAIESFSAITDRYELLDRVAGILPHCALSTRRRIAEKIVQRCFFFPKRKTHARAFLRLFGCLRSDSSRRSLLYWRAARTDAVIERIAGEILYPYFVLDTLPVGYDESTFRMANTGALFSMDHVISRDFAVQFARRTWKFDSPRTITLALRIMRQAEIVDATSVTVGRRHILGYYPLPHGISIEVFAYCMYEEFLTGRQASSWTLDRVHNAAFVKTFLLGRLQVDSLLRSAEKNGLVERISLPGGKHIKLSCPDLDELVSKITGNS